MQTSPLPPQTEELPNELGPIEPERRRLSTAELKALYDRYRRLCGKPFVHTKTGEHYQVLYPSFDESTNEVYIVYCLSSMTWMKFHRKVDEFLQKFEERGPM